MFLAHPLTAPQTPGLLPTGFRVEGRDVGVGFGGRGFLVAGLLDYGGYLFVHESSGISSSKARGGGSPGPMGCPADL